MANKSFQSPSFAGVTSEVLQAEDGLEQLEADNKRLEHVASLCCGQSLPLASSVIEYE
jgi:hypothetical protein